MKRTFKALTPAILPFDAASAQIFARLFVYRRSIGRPVSRFDGMIAATAMAHSAFVATRDRDGFDHEGLTVIDPWTAA